MRALLTSRNGRSQVGAYPSVVAIAGAEQECGFASVQSSVTFNFGESKLSYVQVVRSKHLKQLRSIQRISD